MIENSTARVANFNAGPAAMPQVVLERMQAKMLGYHRRGMSVREMSRRSSDEVAHCHKEPLITVPDSNQWADCESASFLHVTDNETIDGVVLHEVPNQEVPLVCDMSSSILSQPVDIKRYGMIYAGAQKNIGPAGITLVIVKDELLDRSAEKSLPPVFSYSAIDRHELYINRVHPQNRSRMNIPFQLKNETLIHDFLDGASSRGFVGLKGHKSVGGLRASLYNAVTDRAVDALVDYLNSFAEQHA